MQGISSLVQLPFLAKVSSRYYYQDVAGCALRRRLRGAIDHILEALPAQAALRVAHKIIHKCCTSPSAQCLSLGNATRCTVKASKFASAWTTT